MDWFSIPARAVTWPVQRFNGWTKKRGSDRNTAAQGEGMETFHSAEQRHDEAVALAEKLLQKIRRY